MRGPVRATFIIVRFRPTRGYRAAPRRPRHHSRDQRDASRHRQPISDRRQPSSIPASCLLSHELRLLFGFCFGRTGQTCQTGLTELTELTDFSLQPSALNLQLFSFQHFSFQLSVFSFSLQLPNFRFLRVRLRVRG
jgi:hypothetical protein